MHVTGRGDSVPRQRRLAQRKLREPSSRGATSTIEGPLVPSVAIAGTEITDLGAPVHLCATEMGSVKTVTDDPWKQQLEAFGQFIHTQRKLARLSLRDLSDRTEISNAYLSQIERGIHAPSVRVLKSLADAFNISAETMLEQAGFVDEPGDGPPDTEAVIRSDPHLSEPQKEALLAVYRGFVQGSQNNTT